MARFKPSLPPAEVARRDALLERYDAGERLSDLARESGLSQGTLLGWINRRKLSLSRTTRVSIPVKDAAWGAIEIEHPLRRRAHRPQDVDKFLAAVRETGSVNALARKLFDEWFSRD